MKDDDTKQHRGDDDNVAAIPSLTAALQFRMVWA
jgi:hypothetical protein